MLCGRKTENCQDSSRSGRSWPRAAASVREPALSCSNLDDVCVLRSTYLSEATVGRTVESHSSASILSILTCKEEPVSNGDVLAAEFLPLLKRRTYIDSFMLLFSYWSSLQMAAQSRPLPAQ